MECFLNNKLIKQFNAEPSFKEVKVKMDDYKTGDYLSIEYRDDLQCNNCSYELKVVGNAKIKVFILKTNNINELMKIDLKSIILNFKHRKKLSIYSGSLYIVYFTKIDARGKRDSGQRLFNLEIE